MSERFLDFVDRSAPSVDVAMAKAAAKSNSALLARQAPIRSSWEADYAARLIERGVSPEAARRAVALLQWDIGSKGTLTGSDCFTTRDGVEIPISEILLDPTRFDGVVGPDPIEGREYGSTTARLMAKDGRPSIFSYAHGPGVYRLAWDAMSIDHALVAGRIAVPDGLVAVIAGAVMTEADERTIYRAAERTWGATGITAASLESAVTTARQKLKEGAPLTDGQQDLYQRCKAEFTTVHQREGRIAAIVAVEAKLAAAARPDAAAVLGKVVWFLASRDAACGQRRPTLEHLIDRVAGPGHAARMIDRAVAAIATGRGTRRRTKHKR